MNETLSKFLLLPDVNKLEGEIYLERFDTAFKFKAMTDAQMDEYRESCMKKEIVKQGKKAKKVESMDFNKFKKLVIVNHVIEPNMADADFLRQGGWLTPSEFIEAKLTPGEVLDLYQAINGLSGFSEKFEEDVEDAEN